MGKHVWQLTLTVKGLAQASCWFIKGDSCTQTFYFWCFFLHWTLFWYYKTIPWLFWNLTTIFDVVQSSTHLYHVLQSAYFSQIVKFLVFMIQLNFLQPLCTPDSADTYGQINIKKISFLYLCIGRNGFSLEDNRPYTHAVIRVEIKHNEMRLQSTCSGHKSINTLSHAVHI